MFSNKIRNFVIIAHIDHGKSTLADRFLEYTHTIDKRKMKSQYLDQLELERERGITIKMAPVTMKFLARDGEEYSLNLIDTPGHSDFSYEVSRALEAVEGAVLLVDATQGVQAQTLANFFSAKKAGIKIIGVLNKIDLINSFGEKAADSAKGELAEVLGCGREEIMCVSGKTGEGVPGLLEKIVQVIPPPEKSDSAPFKGKELIFDSFYDNHKGVVASVRIFGGEFRADGEIKMARAGTRTKIKETGKFFPEMKPLDILRDGDIGYVATGIKDPEKIKIGDTAFFVDSGGVQSEDCVKFALHGYEEPKPVIFVSFFPEEASEYDFLRKALQKLKLNDSSISTEPDNNEVLGRGFKVGCLGRLHFEITAERLRREFQIGVINTFPSVKYLVKSKRGEMIEVVKPDDLPADYLEISEPMIDIVLIFPNRFLSGVLSLRKKFRFSEVHTETIGDRIKLSSKMPLVELVSDFDDCLKSVSEGYASFSYNVCGYEKTDIARVDFLVSGKAITGLIRFLPKDSLEREARKTVEKLTALLPKQQYTQPIQAVAYGRVIARADITATRKELGNFGKNGGDRTRKMKLWKKQKKGKERLKERADTSIPPEIFKELLKKE